MVARVICFFLGHLIETPGLRPGSIVACVRCKRTMYCLPLDLDADTIDDCPHPFGLAHLLWPQKRERERRVVLALAAPTFDRAEFVAATNALRDYEADRRATEGFLQSYDATVKAGEAASPEQRLQTFMFLISGLEGRGDPRALTPRTVVYENAILEEGLGGNVTASAFP